MRALDGYRVEWTFSDGIHGDVDVAGRIVGRGGVFKPLESPQFFRQVRVDEGLAALVWPNGGDICPDLLHGWAAGEPVSPPEPETVSP